MNMTREFLKHRAAAIYAMAADKKTSIADSKLTQLRSEYEDLKLAMSALPVGRDSWNLWDAFCMDSNVPKDHDFNDIILDQVHG